MPPSPARRGDRYLKAWDIGRKDASVCVVLRAPSPDEPQVWNVVGYRRLVGEDFPIIQDAIDAMHIRYPGPTVVEANSIGKPVIQNLRLPPSELIEHTTTHASNQQMLTEIEMLLQKRTLKIHAEFEQLLAELADYRLENSTLTQDSVMALGFAVTNADSAHAVSSASPSVLDLEPFSSDWYDWYADRRLRSKIDIWNDNDARRGIMPPGERRARERAPQSSSASSLATS